MIAQILHLQSALRPTAYSPEEWAQVVLAEATRRGVDVQDHYEALRRYRCNIEDGIEGAECEAAEVASTIAVKVLRAIANGGYLVTTAMEEGVEWVLIYGPYEKCGNNTAPHW